MQVTAGNKDDILGDGAFSYDPKLNMLIIKKSYSCESKGGNVIEIDMSGLTLYVANDVMLKAGKGKDDCVIRSHYTFTITGPGWLSMSAQNGHGIYGGALNLVDARVLIDVARFGLYNNEYLSTQNCFLNVKGSIAIYRCHGYWLNDCEVIYPYTYRMDTQGNCSFIGDDLYHSATEVTITKAYHLVIAGTKVHKENKDDILGDGSASYDPEAHLLTLKKSIASSDYDVIYNSVNTDRPLTVYVANDVTLSAGDRDYGILSYNDLTITGPGLLEIRGGVNAICSRFCSIRIVNARVEARSRFGIGGDRTNGGNPDVIIKNSYVHSVATDRAESRYYTNALHQCYLYDANHSILPEGVEYRSGSRTFFDADGNPANDVTVNYLYDVWINGSQLTGRTAHDVYGAFTFDPQENVLHVKKDYSVQSNYPIITSKVPDLEIRVEQDATLTSSYVGMALSADTLITGPGKLAVRGDVNGILVRDGATVTLKDMTLNVIGGDGIVGVGEEKLIVDASDLDITGNSTAAILNFAEITLKKRIIRFPNNGRVQGGFVANGDGSYAKNVIIEAPYEEIGSVALTLTPPSLGATPSFFAAVPSGSAYRVETSQNDGGFKNGVAWMEGIKALPDGATFVSGGSYTVLIMVIPRDAHTSKFAEAGEFTATINGQPAAVIPYSSERYGIYCTFEITPTPIDLLELTLPEPREGERITSEVHVPAGQGYSIQNRSDGTVWENGVQWQRNGMTLNPQVENRFEAGESYTVSVLLAPSDEAPFAFVDQADMTVYVNDRFAQFHLNSNGVAIVSYTFTIPYDPSVFTTVNFVSLNVERPVAGGTPDYAVYAPEGFGYRVNDALNDAGSGFLHGVRWKRNGVAIDPSDAANGQIPFAEGEEYTLTVSLLLEDESGYRFAGDLSAAINGETAEVDVLTKGTSVTASYTFTAEDLCTVVWYMNAADPEYTDGAEVPRGTVFGNPPEPSRLDAVFAGWFTDRELTVLYDPTAPIMEDTQLFPLWEALSEIALGDVDGDGSITSTDARLTLQLAVNKIGESDLAVPAAADVDGDGSVTSTDARLILQYAVGKITEWP